jgi:predicted DNA-binding protein with PD1-like motif
MVRSRQINADGEAAFMVVFDRGEDAARGLERFADEHGLTAARISGVGGFSSAKLGFFDWESKSYRDIPVNEQVEVLSFDGDVALTKSGPHVHVHTVLGRADGSTVGGHLMEGSVRPTLEVLVVESPGDLRRVHDEDSGLELIDPDA